MSRLKPILSYFGSDEYKVEERIHSNIVIFKKPDVSKVSKEDLLYLKDTVDIVIKDFTEQMLDRSFYYYDSKEFPDKFIRVYEHTNLDIAVTVNLDYMYDINHSVVSFPDNMCLYQKDQDSLTVDKYVFGIEDQDGNITEEELINVREALKAGDREMLNEIDKKVYAL